MTRVEQDDNIIPVGRQEACRACARLEVWVQAPEDVAAGCQTVPPDSIKAYNPLQALAQQALASQQLHCKPILSAVRQPTNQPTSVQNICEQARFTIGFKY